MKLELKHITPYLPYGLKGLITDVIENENWHDEVESVCFVDNVLTFGDACDVYLDEPNETTFNPILRPLSDLTKEIEHNGEKFVPIERLAYWFDFTYLDTLSLYIQEYPYNVVEKLFEWKFDYFDLIPNGLAIDINTITNDI